MADRISDLPDTVICHILSFLPTKISIATSILSKRWKSLWRSVPTFDFECECDEEVLREEGINYKFLRSINTFLQTRDSCQSLTKFRLSRKPHIYHRRICQPKDVYELISEHHKLEYLHLTLRDNIDFLSVTLHCRTTLVHLQLRDVMFETYLPVDLPSLKILYLWSFYSLEYKFLADLLSRCPNLEDMELTGVIRNYTTEVEFKKCPKLVRAVLQSKGLVPLELVSNVQFLQIIQMDSEDKIPKNTVPRFDNLTHLSLDNDYHCMDWSEPFRLIKRCPKLEHLDLLQGLFTYYYCDSERKDWQNPSKVPKCFSSHLKTCRIDYYGGTESEFKLVKYIMKNATVLQNMVIRTLFTLTKEERLRIRRKLRSVCRRLSSTCKLSCK